MSNATTSPKFPHSPLLWVHNVGLHPHWHKMYFPLLTFHSSLSPGLKVGDVTLVSRRPELWPLLLHPLPPTWPRLGNSSTYDSKRFIYTLQYIQEYAFGRTTRVCIEVHYISNNSGLKTRYFDSLIGAPTRVVLRIVSGHNQWDVKSIS